MEIYWNILEGVGANIKVYYFYYKVISEYIHVCNFYWVLFLKELRVS